MPVKYIPYVPDTISGQAILDTITRTRRVLRYGGNTSVYDHLRRGLPLYETQETEVVGGGASNLLLRGECLSACAYLKDNNIALDLVYIDPPFASGADYAKSVYLRRNPKQAEALAQAEAELELDELRAFEEKMYGDIWNKEDYLNWMFENLTAIKSVMSETASIYVHLDWHIGHYVKILMDEVFGEDNFQREIVWSKGNVSGFKSLAKNWIQAHDTVFFYARSSVPNTFNKQRIEYTEEYLENYNKEDENGEKYWQWSSTERRYLKDAKGLAVSDVWDMPYENNMSSNRTEYATQKPEALLDRIIKASSDEGMIVGDFFGGSGVTAKVAHDLGRRFVHVDVGVNSLQTTRDRLKAAGAAFTVRDIQDGVSLFRNPIQTMDKLKTLVQGLKNDDALDTFWEGAITDSKRGTVPVYLPNLLDHQTKVLDVPQINRVIQEALPELPDSVSHAIVYYVDIYDRPAVEKFLKDENMTGVAVELRDLKELLDDVVLNDDVEYQVTGTEGGSYDVEITRFTSDRLQQKISEYNQKKGLTGKAKAAPALDLEGGDAEAAPKKMLFKPIQISDTGLELIEWVSVDCTQAEGAWHSDAEIKIDKKGFVTRDGAKTKEVWDAHLQSAQKTAAPQSPQYRGRRKYTSDYAAGNPFLRVLAGWYNDYDNRRNAANLPEVRSGDDTRLQTDDDKCQNELRHVRNAGLVLRVRRGYCDSAGYGRFGPGTEQVENAERM